MAKGIIYVMSTAVSGLVKIGKTASEQFETRMYQLESNGYRNVAGLQRQFAIEVDSYDEKENLIDDIFSKSRVHNSELFSLDIDMVIQLLSSFEGTQKYPEPAKESKEEAFIKAAAERKERVNAASVPDGLYFLERKLKRNDNKKCKVEMVVEEGNFIIKAGQMVSPTEGVGLGDEVHKLRVSLVDANGLVKSDVSFDSPSGAGCFAIGAACGGWTAWKTKTGEMLDIYRTFREE